MEDERDRLGRDVGPDTLVDGGLPVPARIRCDGNAAAIESRILEFLKILVDNENPWPSKARWNELLPRWLIDAFESGRAVDDTGDQWSSDEWLPTMGPDERQWFWWRVVHRRDKELLVELAVLGLPTPTVAFVVLARAAGADHVEVDD